MRNLVRHAFIILASIILAVVAITPPESKLRLGKDLAGGTTMVFQVDIRPTDPPGTLGQVIDLLKRRIDPTGLLEIQIEAQGNDRVAITMPLPSGTVKAARARFDAVLSNLTRGALNADGINRLLSLPGDQRKAEIESLAAGDADRLAKLNEAAARHDEAQAASAEYAAKAPAIQEAADKIQAELDAARARGAAPEALADLTKALGDALAQLDALALAPAKADRAAEKAREAVLATTLSPVEMRRALELPKVGRSWRDVKTGKVDVVKSPRERAIDRLKERYPGAAARIDETVKEYDTYQSARTTLDDPDELQRLVRAAGVLTFRITVKPGQLPDEAARRAELREKGPRGVRALDLRWYKINKEDSWFDNSAQQKALAENPSAYFAARGYVVEEFDGQYWMLCHDSRGKRLTASEGAWTLKGSRPGVDNLGKPCITFQMDALGGEKMGELTEGNLQSQMAVLLDDEIYTAPTIQGRISTQGQITGNFGDEEIKYIVRVLGAGSLAAKLSPEPISQVTISPELGVENLRAGLRAAAISFVAISVFMVVYYFACGAVAVISLLINALLILAAMALQHAPFSLPAIAGVILTFGMAVDANVLIYERIREELSHGEEIKSAVRIGFARALSAIVDGHVTILIVCVILGLVGTQEIKGFAITMSVGAVATLFTQLYITRWLIAVLVDRVGLRNLNMLPMAVPAVQKIFHLNVDWMKYRYVFLSISVLLTIVCLATIVVRGRDVLDTEFTGGSKITIVLKKTAEAQDAPRLTMNRSEVVKRINDLAKEAGASGDPRQRVLAELREARTRVVNPKDGTDVSDTFEIKTAITSAGLLRDGLSRAFADVMEVLQALEFTGSQEQDPRLIPVRPILSDQLADVEGIELRLRVPEYVGGAAVILADLKPRPTLDSLESRLRAIRTKADYVDAAARQYRWVVLRGTENAVESAALLVKDDSISYINDQASWAANLKMPTWRMIVDSLGQATSSASVESFSPSVAASFQARAVAAVVLSALLIVIYIWVRFASVRYSMAAITTSLHDCLVAVGLISMGELVYRGAPGVAHALGILPFKIDLNVIASILTILGYSLNDTIVIMDRIREKRGRLPFASREIINRAVNDTISRTIITGGTTLIATMVLYLIGGEAVRAFAFAFLVGIVIGTYSSIAVAAPIVWVRKADHPDEPAGAGSEAQGSRTLPAAPGPGALPPSASQANGKPAGHPKTT
ncbi:MAG: protein translocase subunit SecD [Phycisphaerae bacterium]|nr:protein translocase subunit SecD [Phycisphaerae bacterium]